MLLLSISSFFKKNIILIKGNDLKAVTLALYTSCIIALKSHLKILDKIIEKKEKAYQNIIYEIISGNCL